MSEELLVERRATVLWLTINRPDRRNALTDAVLRGMGQAFAAVERDASIHAIVLTAVGDKAFCGGADLTPGDTPFRPNVNEPSTPMMDLFRAVDRCRVPIVCRVNGHCMAGGMGLLGMCDLAVAADHALFGLPEAKVGIYPMQIMLVLRTRISPIMLNELAMTGDRIDAQTALSYGLLNKVVPPAGLDGAVDELLGRIAKNSPLAIRRGKYAMRAVRDMPFESAASFLESQIPPMIMTDDAKEGLASFNEKRPPKWSS